MVVGSNSICDSVLAKCRCCLDGEGRFDLVSVYGLDFGSLNLPFFQVSHFLKSVFAVNRSRRQVCDGLELFCFTEYTSSSFTAESK